MSVNKILVKASVEKNLRKIDRGIVEKRNNIKSSALEKKLIDKRY